MAVHGRTRECFFKGEAEYETIAAIKATVSIPVIANGDIEDGAKAKQVLAVTGADGLMIARAAQGKPWIFREIEHYLVHGTEFQSPSIQEIGSILIGHLHNLYEFYGERLGVGIARKHVGWYSKGQIGASNFRVEFNQLEKSSLQLAAIQNFFGLEK